LKIVGKILSKALQWIIVTGFAAFMTVFMTVLLMVWMLIKATMICSWPGKIK